jgi:hypothetical protein
LLSELRRDSRDRPKSLVVASLRFRTVVRPRI